MKLDNTPTKKGILNTKSFNLKIVAANTIGAESMNEYLAADSLSTPIALPKKREKELHILIRDFQTALCLISETAIFSCATAAACARGSLS